GVDDGGLVAAGDDHGGAVSGADVLQGHEDVDLSDLPGSGGMAEGHHRGGDVAAAVDADPPALGPQVQEALLEADPVEVALDPAPDLADPRRMIDELLEDLAAFDDVLVIGPVLLAVGMDLDVADPRPRCAGGVVVDPAVDAGDLVAGQGLVQDQESA